MPLNGNIQLAGHLACYGFMGASRFHIDQLSIGQLVARICAIMLDKATEGQEFSGRVGHSLRLVSNSIDFSTNVSLS